MPVPLLELLQVSKSYLSGDVQVPVLKDASLQIFAGESAAITGPSGSGKTTILNLLGTLDLPDSGMVQISGRDIASLAKQEIAQLRNLMIGFVFQSHHLLPHCTVLENVLVPTLAQGGRASDMAMDRAKALLNRVGLAHRAEHLPSRLSGGERQRVAVVRALINSPKIILADEPTGALDRASAAEIGLLLSELNNIDHVTVVVVTHSQELAARFNRRIEVQAGKLIELSRSTSTHS